MSDWQGCAGCGNLIPVGGYEWCGGCRPEEQDDDGAAYWRERYEDMCMRYARLGEQFDAHMAATDDEARRELAEEIGCRIVDETSEGTWCDEHDAEWPCPEFKRTEGVVNAAREEGRAEVRRKVAAFAGEWDCLWYASLMSYLRREVGVPDA